MEDATRTALLEAAHAARRLCHMCNAIDQVASQSSAYGHAYDAFEALMRAAIADPSEAQRCIDAECNSDEALYMDCESWIAEVDQWIAEHRAQVAAEKLLDQQTLCWDRVFGPDATSWGIEQAAKASGLSLHLHVQACVRNAVALGRLGHGLAAPLDVIEVTQLLLEVAWDLCAHCGKACEGACRVEKGAA